ncbi:MAG: DUF4131 domain-containing protein [Kiritimatiellia bacterium]
MLLAAAHAAGAALAVHFPASARWIVPLALCLLLPAAWREGRPRALAALGWLGLAAGLSLWRLHVPESLQPARAMERPREWMEIEAVVLEAPYRDLRLDGSTTPWKAPLDLVAIHRLPEWQAAAGRCQAWWPEEAEEPALRPGERIRLAGVLRAEPGPSAGLQRSRYRAGRSPRPPCNSWRTAGPGSPAASSSPSAPAPSPPCASVSTTDPANVPSSSPCCSASAPTSIPPSTISSP